MSRQFLAGLALVVALPLSGCGAAPELAPSAADRLQEQVLAVTTAASEGRFADARSALDAAERDLDAAAGQNEVSPERYRQVLEAVRLVRADLDAALAQAEAEAQAARDAELAQQLKEIEDQAAAEQAAAAEAAAEEAAAEEAAADDDGSGNSGNGNSGGGDGNNSGGNGDQGNGKGKDD